MPPSFSLPAVIIGAGPYGLSLASHFAAKNIPHRIFGAPMQTWRQRMPHGMLLKSDGFASSLSDPDRAYTLAAFCAERGISYADTGWSVPVEVFAAYGEAFQRRFVPHLETIEVRNVVRAALGFDVSLADGRVIAASKIVLATGLTPFPYLPAELLKLSPNLVSHSRDAADLRHHAGHDVIVIGGGASALDVAASLHRAGARATVVARRDTLRFFPPRTRRPFEAIRAPQTPLGPGWKKLLCARAPSLFRLLPVRMRLGLLRRHLGPAPAYSVKETVEKHVSLITGARIDNVEAASGGVRFSVVSGRTRLELAADHVIAATGYRIDFDRLTYLDPALRAEVGCVEGSPLLSSRFETSARGVYVIGTAAAATFGPLLRFVCGAEFASRQVTKALRGLWLARPISGSAGVSSEAASTRVAFLTLTNDVGSDRIVAAMGREGASCAVIGTPDSYAYATRFAEHRTALAPWGGSTLSRLVVRGHLERLVTSWTPDRILPLDDLAARVLRRLATAKRTSPELRAIIVASTGDPAGYASLSRKNLLDAAAASGLRVPETYVVPDLGCAKAESLRLGFPLVLKREETCGGGGVDFVRDLDELAAAYVAARRRGLLKRLIERSAALIGGEDTRELGRIDEMLSLQSFVTGRLAMRTVACRDGRVLEGLSLVARMQTSIPIGASTILSAIEHDEMEVVARSLVGSLKLSGFASFDFILDAVGHAHLLEMNPRPIGSTHLGAMFGHDLCRAYLADLAGLHHHCDSTSDAWTGSVALFPRELLRDPSGEKLWPSTAVRHDVMNDDDLVRERYLDLLSHQHPSFTSHLRAIVSLSSSSPARASMSHGRTRHSHRGRQASRVVADVRGH